MAQEKQGTWIISVIGATLKKLRDDANDAALSPDGSQIVFHDATTQELWVMNADGRQAHLLIKSEAGYHLFKPTWFPDGQRIAYGRFHSANGQTTIALESSDLKGSDPEVLYSNPRLQDFCWAQAGRLIFTQGNQPPNQYDSNLWELRFDPHTGKPKDAPRQLTDWTGFSFDNLAMTSDNKRLVFLNDHVQSDVYVGELANGELRPPERLTLDDRLDWPAGWSQDSKTILFYSNLAGNLDVYKQNVAGGGAQPVVTGEEEKREPQFSPDGKWILYLAWPKAPDNAVIASGKLMREPVNGGPPEPVMDIAGHPGSATSNFAADTVNGFPSFRCRAICVLAEKVEDKKLAFTQFDPQSGRKGSPLSMDADPDLTSWNLSPDGKQLVLSKFDFKSAEVQIMPLAVGSTQKLSALPWTQLVSVAWAADGGSLLLTAFSSRGASVISLGLSGPPRLLRKTTWDIYSIFPSPDGRSLALGPLITNANAWTIADFPEK